MTSRPTPSATAAPSKTPNTDEPIVRIPLTLLDDNPYQRRREMEAGKLKELTASVLQHGLLQPVVVRKAGERYQLVAGHRRATVYRRLSQEGADAERFLAI